MYRTPRSLGNEAFVSLISEYELIDLFNLRALNALALGCHGLTAKFLFVTIEIEVQVTVLHATLWRKAKSMRCE